MSRGVNLKARTQMAEGGSRGSLRDENKLMPLKRTNNGQTNLQIWRVGRSYERQKGNIYRREWNNLLFTMSPQPAEEKDILYFDVRQPLPYLEHTFNAVFLLHIIEHLTPQEGEFLLREIYRTLKPLGIIRISTPDLEDICLAYLECLEAYDRNATKTNLIKYEWSVLELLDQSVRAHSGGLMKEYIKNGYYDPSYAKRRFGDVFDEFYVPPQASATQKKALIERLLRLTPQTFCRGIYRRIMELCQKFVDESQDDPRKSGEVNKWLYDFFSLATLLQKTRFHQISRKTYRTSDIPDWDRFDLDRSTLGDYAIEPSLYMEARKS